jgi:hypothetical protein
MFVRRKQPHELKTVDCQTDLDMNLLNDIQSKMGLEIQSRMSKVEMASSYRNDYGLLSQNNSQNRGEHKMNKRISILEKIEDGGVNSEDDLEHSDTFGE